MSQSLKVILLRRLFLGMRFLVSVMVGAALVISLTVPVSAHAATQCSYTGLTELTDFGDNPGELKGYYYKPANLPKNAPLVVALHGCGQKACDYDDEPGWTVLAERLQFALLLPEEQKMEALALKQSGNDARCFKWWERFQQRGDGEPASIMQMVKLMVDRFQLDPQRIYITGLSAGAGMTVVMLSNYPDCFAGGAPIAGIPFNCSEGWLAHVLGQECMCMKGVTNSELCAQMKEPLEKPMTARAWGDAVRKKTCHPLAPQGNKFCPDTVAGGKWPRISIWQGTQDIMVAPVNLNRLMLQWTDLHHLDPVKGKTVSKTVSPYKLKQTSYADQSGRVLVETNLIMSSTAKKVTPATGHATAVDPDKGCGCDHVDCACEKAGVCNKDNETGYIKDANFCSSVRIARFWGLDHPAASAAAAERCAALR